MADRTGQVIGQYRCLKMLGKGGFAEVYLGRHLYLNTLAAIKVLNTQITEEDRKKFLAEAQLIAHMEHPNIVRVLDFGFDQVQNNAPFLVMAHAPGGSLRERLPKGSPFPIQAILPYVSKIAAALQYAHDEHRLIHRDVKPENMLLGSNREVLLSDFGISIIARSTPRQEVAGTAPYMAPEQIKGTPQFASDQYALGIVVYEWLTGQVPFKGSFTQVCTHHLLSPPPPLRTLVPISPVLEQVVLTALSKEPNQRFASIRAFAHALEQVSTPASSTSMPFSTTLSSVCLQCGTLLPPGGQFCSSCGYHNMPQGSPAPNASGQSLSSMTGTGMPYAISGDSVATSSSQMPLSTMSSREMGYSQIVTPPPLSVTPPPIPAKRPDQRLIIPLVLVAVLLLGLGVAWLVTGMRPGGPEACISPPVQNAQFVECFDTNQQNWDTSSPDPKQYSITIGNNALVLEDHLPGLLPERVPNKTFSDFTLTVDANLARGTPNDSYGVYLRGHFDPAKGVLDTFYRFELYGDGSFAVFKDAGTPLMPRTGHPAIKKAGQTNQLSISAHGPRLVFSVNSTTLATITDASYLNGEVALFVGNLDKSPVGVRASFTKLLII